MRDFEMMQGKVGLQNLSMYKICKDLRVAFCLSVFEKIVTQQSHKMNNNHELSA